MREVVRGHQPARLSGVHRQSDNTALDRPRRSGFLKAFGRESPLPENTQMPTGGSERLLTLVWLGDAPSFSQ